MAHNIYYRFVYQKGEIVTANSKKQIGRKGREYTKHPSKDLNEVIAYVLPHAQHGLTVTHLNPIKMDIKEALTNLHYQFLQHSGSLDDFAKSLGLTREQAYQLTRIGERLKTTKQ